jgi:hypothetical protein
MELMINLLHSRKFYKYCAAKMHLFNNNMAVFLINYSNSNWTLCIKLWCTN